MMIIAQLPQQKNHCLLSQRWSQIDEHCITMIAVYLKQIIKNINKWSMYTCHCTLTYHRWSSHRSGPHCRHNLRLGKAGAVGNCQGQGSTVADSEPSPLPWTGQKNWTKNQKSTETVPIGKSFTLINCRITSEVERSHTKILSWSLPYSIHSSALPPPLHDLQETKRGSSLGIAGQPHVTQCSWTVN